MVRNATKISIVFLITTLVSCSSWKNTEYIHKTEYQINEFKLPLLTMNAQGSVEKVIEISQKLGFRELTPENFRTPENYPLRSVTTKGYLLEFKEDDLVYYMDIDTMERESLTIKFEKEKYFLKKISDSDFKKMSNHLFSKVKEEYQKK